MPRLEPRLGASTLFLWASPLLALALTAVTSGLIFAALDRPPIEAAADFLVAPLFAAGGLAAVAGKAAPLALIAAGLAVAYRAEVWNIGAEGQFTIGAIFAGGVALSAPDDASPWLVYPAVVAAGAAGGMVWAAIVAWLRTSFRANEILTSLMLNYVAQFALVYLVTQAWRDQEGLGFPQTALFPEPASAPRLADGVFIGAPAALLAALAMQVLLDRSVLGFRLRVLGQAPRAARFAGFSEAGLIWTAMLLSGALAGLAGAFEATGPLGQLTTSLSPGYGFTAIITAFLGRLQPLGAVPAGILLAITYLGGETAQIRLGLPNAVTGVVQGVLLFYLLGCDVLIRNRVVWRRAAPARA